MRASLGQHITETGQYYLPHAPENAGFEENQKMETERKGKPWAVIAYHKDYIASMPKNILRGLLSPIIGMLLISWLLFQIKKPTLPGIFLSNIFIGVAAYIFIPYSLNIWYETPDAVTNLADTLIGWGLSGIWLGWWIPRTADK